jgi:hypothetical protein
LYSTGINPAKIFPVDEEIRICGTARHGIRISG